MGIFLALHSLVISLRVMLGVNLSMMKMYSNTDPGMVKSGFAARTADLAKRGTQKVSKTALDKSMKALKTAGTAEMRVAAVSMQYMMNHSEGSIKHLKRLIRFVDLLIVVLILIDLLVLALIITVLVLLVAVLVAVTQGGVIGPSDGGGGSYANQQEQAQTGNTTGTSTVTGALLGSEAVPEGMDPTKWNEASPNGKRIASTAILTQNMKFPGDAANDKNNGRLVYKQGVDMVGYYDCNVFASGIYESLGFTEGAGPRKGDPYDFNKMNRKDLQGWKPTASATPYLKGKITPVAQAKTGMDTSNIKPGDLFIGGGHAMIYLGKNTKGEDIVAHAINPGSTIYSDVLLTKPVQQVGITTLDWILPSMTGRGSVYVFRSDDLIKAS